MLGSCYSEQGDDERKNSQVKLISYTIDEDISNYCLQKCFVISTQKSNDYHVLTMKYSARENSCSSFKLNWLFHNDTLEMEFIDTTQAICDTIPAKVFVTSWQINNLARLWVQILKNNPQIDTLIEF